MQAHDTRLTQRRVEAFRRDVRQEYDRYSIIQKIFRPREASEDEKEKFVQIGMRFFTGPEIFIDSYSRGENTFAPTIVGVGQSIATGEEKYLVRLLQTKISNEDVAETLSFDNVARSLRKHGVESPASVFVPLEFYSVLHLGKYAPMRVAYKNYDPFLVLGSMSLPMYWSNQYVPFDRFIFVGRDLGEWIVKPDPETGHNVIIEVNPPKGGKVDVTVKTIACFSDRNRAAGLLLKAPFPKQAEV
jgi:hypothetical protein